MPLKFAPSTYQGVTMIEIQGPWYTYTRPATATELATGEQTLTQYDREIAAKYRGTPDEYRAAFAIELRKKGLELD